MPARLPIALFNGVPSSEALEAAAGVLRSGQIASGPKVEEFESRFGDLAGQGHIVATSDMTSAMVLALVLADVRQGDDVLTLAYSCMSSNAAIAQVGAQAVWVDIEPCTASMSVSDLAHALTPRTRAVSLYHVAGYPAATVGIVDFCRAHGIALIEDCNNAVGATVDGRPVGLLGDFAVYSFYPNRQINALEGGALACRDAALAARARRLRRFGIDTATFRDTRGEINPASDIPEIGWSASFSQLNAAVGLQHLASWPGRLTRVREIAVRYRKALGGITGLADVRPCAGVDPAYWGFLILAERRDHLLAALKRSGILASLLHHRNDDYSGFHSRRRPLPGTQNFMSRVMALPCGWWLTDEQVSFVIDTLCQQADQLA